MYDFPWDPKPESVGKSDAAPVMSNAKPVPQPLPSNGTINTPSSSASTPGPQIKHEAQQYATQPPLQAKYAPQYTNQPMAAEHRAAMLLKQNYGERAGSQIAQLQSGQQRVPTPSNAQPQPQQPYIKQEDIKQEEYRPTYNASVPVKSSQTDGAGDARAEYDAEIARRRAVIAKHREASDRLIRDHVLASQKSMEGGGLLMPLNAHTSAVSLFPQIHESQAGSSLSRAQGDAAGDEDEDEDAINSDLDDPDDLDDHENEEENVSNVMLCTYDKVQRVKNKWKCTLKDGVLKVNDQE